MISQKQSEGFQGEISIGMNASERPSRLSEMTIGFGNMKIASALVSSLK